MRSFTLLKFSMSPSNLNKSLFFSRCLEDNLSEREREREREGERQRKRKRKREREKLK